MLVYHDFLIEYRQTPRSKILRKHLPSMEAVVEEESTKDEPTAKCNCNSKKLNKLSIKLNKKTMDLANFYLKHPIFRNYKNRTSHKIKSRLNIKSHMNKLENMIGDLESIIKNLSETMS